MALNNILSPRQQVQNSKGQPLAGGNVFLYLPGTTQFIPSYRSAELTAQNAFPVSLSSSGRAEIWITQDCDLVIQDRLGNIVITQDNANPGAIGQDVSGLVPNGSFEIDTDGNGQPDSWTLVSLAGSTNALDATTQTDGAYSYRFTGIGVAGGGTITSQDFFPVNGVNDLNVKWDMFSSITGLGNTVTLKWYDSTFVFISNSVLYNSTAPPLVWTTTQVASTPPGTARFAKLVFAGVNATTGPGSTWYDRVSAFYPTSGSVGIFGNITIQLNEILSTNTNGLISLKPNGTGQVQIWDTVAAAPSLGLCNVGGTRLGQLLHSTDLILRSETVSGKVSLQAKDSGSVNRTLLVGDPNAGVTLNFAGVAKLRTDTQGTRFLDPGATDYVLIYSDGTDNVIDAVNPNAIRMFPASTALNQLRLGPATSVSVALGTGTPTGGIQVGSTTSGAQVGYTAYAADGTRNWAAFFGVHDNDVWGLAVRPVLGGTPVFQVQSNGEVLIKATQDGAAELYFNNASTARTITAATGGLEANNTLTGAGFERVATITDIGMGSGFSGTLSGSFTPTWTVMAYRIVGGLCYLRATSGVEGVSNATGMTFTNLPAVCQRASGLARVTCSIRNNSADEVGYASFGASGTVTFGIGTQTIGGFNAGGTNKGVETGWVAIYPLN
jgi:hypothetical protein